MIDMALFRTYSIYVCDMLLSKHQPDYGANDFWGWISSMRRWASSGQSECNRLDGRYNIDLKLFGLL